MSEARALTNLVGNGVATVVVSSGASSSTRAPLQRELAGEGNASSPASDIPVGGREAVQLKPVRQGEVKSSLPPFEPALVAVFLCLGSGLLAQPGE